MTDSTDLERRYRRLLAAYPKAFREEHEQEMLAVLMADADAGRRRPDVATAADLLGHGIWARLRYSSFMSPFARKHPILVIWVRILSGLWLFIFTGYLCSYGMWWSLSLLAPAALHFYLAVRLGQYVQRQSQDGSPPSEPPPVAGA